MEEIEIVRVRLPDRGVFAFDANGLDFEIGDYCIIEDVDDSIELGQIVGRLKIPKAQSQVPLKKIRRLAEESDKARFKEKARKEAEAREICRKKIKDRGLPMRLVRTRYSATGKKITFYFTSERRVDFRELVKDLAYIFKRRIELRQIGVRDETKMFGGFGCCGRQLCCSNFLHKLGRMEIRMAKEQDMTLTPSKISGVCGRLLCCLRYENEWYHEMKQAMPNIGSTIQVDDNKVVVEELDLFHHIIKARDGEGKTVQVALEDVKKDEKPKRKRRNRRRRR